MHTLPGTLPALWKGVVAIERPDPSRQPHGTDAACRVLSARTQEGGRRAIVTQVPYSLVRHLFRLEDGDLVFAYAELYGHPSDAHLQFFDRASQREFFFHPEQLVAA